MFFVLALSSSSSSSLFVFPPFFSPEWRPPLGPHSVVAVARPRLDRLLFLGWLSAASQPSHQVCQVLMVGGWGQDWLHPPPKGFWIWERERERERVEGYLQYISSPLFMPHGWGLNSTRSNQDLTKSWMGLLHLLTPPHTHTLTFHITHYIPYIPCICGVFRENLSIDNDIY